MAVSRLPTGIARYGLVGVIALSSCGRAPVAATNPAPQVSRARCWLAPPPSTAVESLVVVVDDRIGDGRSDAAADGESVPMPLLAVDGAVVEQCAAEPSRLVASAGAHGADSLVAAGPHVRSGTPEHHSIRVVRLGPRDLREELDGGADVLVTADLQALRYARARGDLIVIALAPRWIYGVVSIGRDSANPSVPAVLADLRRSLAHDVVPVDAREYLELEGAPALCHSTLVQSGPRVAPAIAYHADDPVGRAIAERLVSLAASADAAALSLLPSRASGLAAVPRDARDLVRALEAGDHAAYVVAWRAERGPSCIASGTRSAADTSTGADAGRSPTPLIVVAEWLIVRRGVAGVLVDSAGSLRLVHGNVGERGAP